MEISVEQDWFGTYRAVDLDTYDGAPDSGHQPMGQGATEQEAINDLLEILKELEA